MVGPSADEESKTVHSGFPRVGASVPQASPNRRLAGIPVYPEDDNSDVIHPNRYNLQAALDGDPNELLAMNERNALNRILGHEDEEDEPLFPMARNNRQSGASRIV